MIIAIDGPAASGKGTLGRRLAAHYGYAHLDTGLLYRAVARAVLDRGQALTDLDAAVAAARALDLARFEEARLRGREMGEAASTVSAFPPVRDALLAFQRGFAAQPPGAVLDGRDIGTVVCPEAHVKLFVTARAEERARRRYAELRGRGEPAELAAILADIERRDARDANRAAAPLRQAADAVLLDTTRLDAEAAFRAALRIVEERRGGPREARA
jgi:cytidylate kinase